MSTARYWLIVAVVGASSAVMVGFINNDYYLRVLFMICVYYLCAVGMNVLVGFAGQASLGQAGLYAAGAYTAALLTSRWGVNPWLALLAAPVVAGSCGALIALPSLRVKGPYLAMVTMAFGIVVEKIVTSGEIFGGPQGISGIGALNIGGVPFSSQQWVWFGIVLCVIVQLLLNNLLSGRVGRAFLSLQADEIAAASVGVRVYRTKVIAFIIAAITCGIAGALVAQQNQYINSDFITLNLSIFILLMVLFGGAGSMAGPLIGAVLLTLIDAVLARWPPLQHFAYGALLLFALYAMPNGVAGLFTRKHMHPSANDESGSTGIPEGELRLHKRLVNTSGALLEVKGLNKAFGGVRAARDVGFKLRHGDIHALIGPNGAGKTTIINMITGIVRPDSGVIEFLGEEITSKAADEVSRMGVGRTFQNLRLFGYLSVLDNVMIGCHPRMVNGFWSSLLQTPMARSEERRARQRAIELLEMLGLAAHALTPAGSLPYGLQKRVEIARALASEPALLLLDEPAAGLNPQEVAELGQFLVRICEAGVSILMVEHHMDLVMSVSQHVIVLDYGVKISEGNPLKVQTDPAVIEAYLGSNKNNKSIEHRGEVHDQT